MNQTIECGRIINTHGIAGEVKIDSYCDEGFFRRISRISTGSETFEVLSSRNHKGFVLARLQGINTVEDFDRVLIDNCANFYCASHQAELAEYLYVPAIDAMAKQVTDKAQKNDRSPLSAEETRRIRDKVLAMSLSQMKTEGMRTATAFCNIVSGLEAAAACFLSQSVKSQSSQGGLK